MVVSEQITIGQNKPTTIEMNTLPAGLYLLRAVNEETGAVAEKKVIKE